MQAFFFYIYIKKFYQYQVLLKPIPAVGPIKPISEMGPVNNGWSLTWTMSCITEPESAQCPCWGFTLPRKCLGEQGFMCRKEAAFWVKRPFFITETYRGVRHHHPEQSIDAANFWFPPGTTNNWWCFLFSQTNFCFIRLFFCSVS